MMVREQLDIQDSSKKYMPTSFRWVCAIILTGSSDWIATLVIRTIAVLTPPL